MKRTALIEWGLITVALIFGFKFLTSFLSIFVQAIFSYSSTDTEVVVKILLVSILYLAAFMILIRQSQKIAEFINGPAHADDILPLSIGKRALLHVIIIAVCIVSITSNIATIIYSIFDLFKKEVRSNGLLDIMNEADTSRYSLILAVIETVTAIIILAFSKKIADALIRKDELDELTFDSKPGS